MSCIHDIARAMSYIPDMLPDPDLLELTRQLGATLRAERMRQAMTQADLARKARIPRQKLIQVEQGKPGVALLAYAAVMNALDLAPAVKPAAVPVAEYPQLQRLAWNRPGADTISEPDALALYERHWDLIDEDKMRHQERAFLQRLVDRYGNGILHV